MASNDRLNCDGIRPNFGVADRAYLRETSTGPFPRRYNEHQEGGWGSGRWVCNNLSSKLRSADDVLVQLRPRMLRSRILL